MKYRIVKVKEVFIIQQNYDNFWLEIPLKYSRYSSLEEAKEFLTKFINCEEVVYEVEV